MHRSAFIHLGSRWQDFSRHNACPRVKSSLFSHCSFIHIFPWQPTKRRWLYRSVFLEPWNDLIFNGAILENNFISFPVFSLLPYLCRWNNGVYSYCNRTSKLHQFIHAKPVRTLLLQIIYQSIANCRNTNNNNKHTVVTYKSHNLSSVRSKASRCSPTDRSRYWIIAFIRIVVVNCWNVCKRFVAVF